MKSSTAPSDTEDADQLTVPTVGLDRDRTICFWNKPAAELYGYNALEALGRQQKICA